MSAQRSSSPHLALSTAAEQPDAAVEPAGGDARRELALELAVTRDAHVALDAGSSEVGDRIDEMTEALLLHESPDGRDPEGPAGRGRRPVREAVELEPVVLQHDLPRVLGEAGAEAVEVVPADRDDVVGALDEHPELGFIDALMEDVLRMQGDGVRDPAEPGRDLRDPARQGAEVGVQVGEPRADALRGEAHPLRDLRGLVGGELREAVSEASCEARDEPFRLRDVGPRLPELVVLGDERHRGLHAGQLRVEPGVARGAQGEDRDLLALCFPREDLGDHERLREAWVHLHDVARLRCRLHARLRLVGRLRHRLRLRPGRVASYAPVSRHPPPPPSR